MVRAACEGDSGFDCKGMAGSGLWTGVILFARCYWGREDKDDIVSSWIGVHEWRTIEKKLKENVIRIGLLNLNSNNFFSSRASCIKRQEFRSRLCMILDVSYLSYNHWS